MLEWVMQQKEITRKKRYVRAATMGSNQGTPAFHFSDPLFSQQWYLNGGAEDGMDMNVGPAWAKGYTGKGVVVSILDDGIQTNHPDLIANYECHPLMLASRHRSVLRKNSKQETTEEDRKASSDINDNDDDPMPRDNEDNKHGTRCAGEVAASAHNNYCGVGVAYNASIGGVRMLDGSVNDAVEARALSLNPDHIDIYSASWGPEDDGKTVDGPGPLATRAFINGITTGRGGKGSIFVWASGNGGRHTDSCNCDGYTNSIYTLSISSATQTGLKPWYLEECSSTIATTYSSGTLGRDMSVASVDMDPKLRPEKLCTTQHTGTSASAPLAAGMVALALEANPELTWRDVQHIVVMAAKSAPLEKEAGWTTNGANRKVSHKFGFGLMDGEAMVTLAEQWRTVPQQLVYKTQEIVEEKYLGSGQGSLLTVKTNVTGRMDLRYLEQVQCKISLSLQPRGHLKLELVSAQGTRSTLLNQRPRDTLAANFEDWPFLTVHYWGENPLGEWTLIVTNAGQVPSKQPGILHKWQLIFYGTEIDPVNPRSPSVNPWFQYKKKKDDHITSNEVLERDRIQGSRMNSIKCHPQCDASGCHGSKPSQCFKCANFRLHRTCVEECPRYGYYAGADGVCSRCNGNCLTCSGPGLDSCLSCLPGLYLVTDLGLCLHHCPYFYYEDSDNWKCIGCRENCASCHKSPRKCSSCEPGLVLHNGSCLQGCPRKTCLNHHRRCIPCRMSCTNCTDILDCHKDLTNANSSATQCRPDALCPAHRHMAHHHHQCKKHVDIPRICPQGFYSVNGVCKRCWSSCTACYGGRRDECLGCYGGLKLTQNGECRPLCRKHMFHRQFYSESNRTTAYKCDDCHISCATCNSGGPYGCTLCALGRYLEKSTGLCPSCHPTCTSCSGPEPDHCTSCPHGFLTHQGRCTTSTESTNPCHHCAYSDNAGKRGIKVEPTAEVEVLRALHQSKSPQYSPVVTVTVIAVIACLAIAILFTLLISALQIR